MRFLLSVLLFSFGFGAIAAESESFAVSPSLIGKLTSSSPENFYIETPYSDLHTPYHKWQMSVGAQATKGSVPSPYINASHDFSYDGYAADLQYNLYRNFAVTARFSAIQGQRTLDSDSLDRSPGYLVPVYEWHLGSTFTPFKFHVLGSHAIDLGLAAGITGDFYSRLPKTYIGYLASIPLGDQFSLIAEKRKSPGQSETFLALGYGF